MFTTGLKTPKDCTAGWKFRFRFAANTNAVRIPSCQAAKEAREQPSGVQGLPHTALRCSCLPSRPSPGLLPAAGGAQRGAAAAAPPHTRHCRARLPARARRRPEGWARQDLLSRKARHSSRSCAVCCDTSGSNTRSLLSSSKWRPAAPSAACAIAPAAEGTGAASTPGDSSAHGARPGRCPPPAAATATTAAPGAGHAGSGGSGGEVLPAQRRPAGRGGSELSAGLWGGCR